MFSSSICSVSSPRMEACFELARSSASAVLHECIHSATMAVQGDDQRQRIGMDKLNAVFVINVLLPWGRQMHFNGVEVVTPFIGIVSRDATTGDGARHAEHGVVFSVQIEGDRRSRSLDDGPGVNWERI